MSSSAKAFVRDQGGLLREEARRAGLSLNTISKRRKLARGECRDCSRPRYEDHVYCHLHHLLRRFATRLRTGARPVGKGGG